MNTIKIVIEGKDKPSRLPSITAEQYLNICEKRNARLKKIRLTRPFPKKPLYDLKSYIDATQENAETDTEIFNYLLKGGENK